MNIFTRRIIAISFIIAFLVITPITLLYTTGFRYNWQKKKISEVGVLALKTYPADTQIYINNQLQKGASPLYLNDLEPNIYTIRAELPNYFSWEKNLEVKSRTSTLAYDIVLFKKSKPQTILQGDINAYTFDHSSQHIALVRDAETLEITSPTGDTRHTLYTSPTKNLQNIRLSWSANNSYILIENLTSPASSRVIPTDGIRPSRSLGELANSTVSSPYFDLTDDESLYVLSKKDLIKINPKSFDTTTLAHNIESFKINPLGIIAITTAKEAVNIMQISTASWLNSEKILAQLPAGSYALLPSNNQKFIAVVNKTEGKVLLISTENTSKPAIELDGSSGVFGEGDKNDIFLVIGTDEINVFDIKNEKTLLLGRYGKSPSVALPVYNIPYYLLYLDGQIQITELDDRDKRNTNYLISNPSISNITLETEGKRLFYTTPEGFFTLPIQ